MKILCQPPRESIGYVTLVAVLAAAIGGMGLTPLYSIWWWDIVCHAGAGAVIALITNIRLSTRASIASVLVCAIAWEIFEWSIGTPFTLIGPVDTVTDIAYTAIGGLIGSQSWYRQ